MILDLRLDMSPTEICTAQQKGASVIGKHIHFFTKPIVIESKKKIRKALERAMTRSCTALVAVYGKGNKVIGYECAKPIAKDKAVACVINYCFPFTKGETKKKGFDGKDEWMTVRPDVDNLTKSVMDVMTDMKLWEDDSQVVVLTTTKMRVLEPCIEIKIFTESEMVDARDYHFSSTMKGCEEKSKSI